MVLARVAATARARATNALRTIQRHPPNCPCHGNPMHPHNAIKTAQTASRFMANPATEASRQKEYAFEMAASSIRFGPGSTREVGMDFKNMNAKKVLVLTDKTLAQLSPMKVAIEALEREGIQYEVYDKCRVEPKDYSVKEAIAWGKARQADAFLAVGGGSVMDTAKIVNLYTAYPEADFLDFVNAPLGKGLPITKPLKPLICVPTTSGTGSETTGTAIFDLVDKKAKTGIAHRTLKPTLGICDPLNTRTLPAAVHCSSGLDVLCHALESYTAIPFNERVPRPTNPILRPAYQGANPISDVFSLQALKATIKYLPRAVRDPNDSEAQSQMMLAATLAGVGFGNAGVHLCHGLSYGISGNNRGFQQKGYDIDHPLIPHGISVAVTAPAVFAFTAASNPERHLEVAQLFGADITNARAEDAGAILSEAIMRFLAELGIPPRGLKPLGFGRSDIEELVQATLPQRRVLMLAPNYDEEIDRQREVLSGILEESLTY